MSRLEVNGIPIQDEYSRLSAPGSPASLSPVLAGVGR